jgi:hypothetical protein
MAYTFMDVDTAEEITVKVAGEGLDAGDKAPYKAMTGAPSTPCSSHSCSLPAMTPRTNAESRGPRSARSVSSRRSKCESCRD